MSNQKQNVNIMSMVLSNTKLPLNHQNIELIKRALKNSTIKNR